jgi:hypothetical protein
MLVRRRDARCRVRGTGLPLRLGLKDYKATRAICGIPIPEGLLESAQLPNRYSRPQPKHKAGTIWALSRSRRR